MKKHLHMSTKIEDTIHNIKIQTKLNIYSLIHHYYRINLMFPYIYNLIQPPELKTLKEIPPKL